MLGIRYIPLNFQLTSSNTGSSFSLDGAASSVFFLASPSRLSANISSASSSSTLSGIAAFFTHLLLFFSFNFEQDPLISHLIDLHVHGPCENLISDTSEFQHLLFVFFLLGIFNSSCFFSSSISGTG